MGNPWDIPPNPTTASDDSDDLYAAVGKALSSWDEVESVLAEIFSLFVGTPIGMNPLAEPPIRAHGSVISFNGRAEMVDAASQAYFHSRKTPTAFLETALKGLLTECRNISGRRNDIAHGRVELMFASDYDWWTQEEPCWLFLPGLLATKRYSLDNEPSFIYTVAELTYFKDQFKKLAERLADFKAELWKLYTSP